MSSPFQVGVIIHRVSVLVFVLLAIVGSIVVLRTLSVGSRAPVQLCDPYRPHFFRLSNDAIHTLIEGISIPTISEETKKINSGALLQFHELIFRSFPTIHNSSVVELEKVNNHSLLYKFQGSDPNLLPYFLAAHIDVVPANPATWHEPPFQGTMKEGFIYGRGTIDDKGELLGILEAVEALLKSGFQPKRTFYLGFGHDEEIHGNHGARYITDLLKSRKIKMEFVLDEGMFITKGIMKMVPQNVAIIGVVEKGSAMVQLTVRDTAGHSSAPPPTSAIGILAKAISRLEDNPHPSMFGKGIEKTMLELLAPHVSLLYTTVFSNIWLFGPIISYVMSRDRYMNPILRTTTAVTIVQGGVKANVIPAEAKAIVNHRIHPLQTLEEVLAYDEYVIQDDRVQVEVLESMKPSKISPHSDDSFGFDVIRTSVHEIFADTLVVPGMMVANSDCRWYQELSESIYRFAPVIIEKSDVPRYHGDDERISVSNYEKLINFYHHVITNADRSGEEHWNLKRMSATKRKMDL